MNIFLLDRNHSLNAQYHMDAHLNKMPLEAAHILCTAAFIKGIAGPYRPISPDHPCVKWTLRSVTNWNWLIAYGISLCTEHEHRYGTHRWKLLNVFNWCKNKTETIQLKIPLIGLVEHPRIVAPDCRDELTVVDCYRKYYVQHKSHLAAWKHRGVPEWYQEMSMSLDSTEV